jgi:hypothetical protein
VLYYVPSGRWVRVLVRLGSPSPGFRPHNQVTVACKPRDNRGPWASGIRFKRLFTISPFHRAPGSDVSRCVVTFVVRDCLLTLRWRSKLPYKLDVWRETVTLLRWRLLFLRSPHQKPSGTARKALLFSMFKSVLPQSW